ncbi:MAG TPA: FxSxx-COOH system tetratricopeptide repeat protein [Candidatus Dormibacteraeota bacterium]|nr:FxSxx-COOH system tetratricopeptide repeat protein [Candidatus Dormibacteraeota bacterium]
MTATDEPKDFFISRTGIDKGWAQWIGYVLEEEGYTVHLQDWDFRPGKSFVRYMQEGAILCRRTLAVLSPDYFNGAFSAMEWEAALTRDPTGTDRVLVTVRVRECPPPGLLSRYPYIDLVGLDETTARSTLLEGVAAGRQKPSTRPPFPSGRPQGAPPTFPGPVFRVPPRNPIFTGREQLLTNLEAALASGIHTALVQAITGLGGAGKTQVAIEYAHRHRHRYRVIWWLRAETPETLLEDLAALAIPLGLAVPTDAPPAEVATTVRRELENTPGWLLVFDNADSIDVIRAHLPGGGHVLITSRNPAWRARATVLDVDVWSPPEAVAFLLTRTGRNDADGAAALAEALGHLPLALEQAGAFMEVNATPFARYLHLYRGRGGLKLLAQHGPSDYAGTVATTWRLSFDQVREASPTAAELLELCAFLAPDAIPDDLFQPADRGPLPPALRDADDRDVEEAIGVLRRYSLIQRNDGTIGLHRLVQEVIRNALAAEVTRERVTAGVLLLHATFPESSDDVRTWQRCARLLPHALAVADHAESLATEPEATSWLLDRVATYLLGRAELTPARRLFERALAIDEAAYGPHHPDVAGIVNNLARVLHDLGDLAGARRLFERALAIDEAAYGPHHPDVATDVNNLALVLRDLGDLAGARQGFERALAIDEAAYGPDHPTVATFVNNLASVLQDLGDLAGARQLLERALAIAEAAFGPDHPTVARDVNNLASVLRDLGDLAGARQGFERALAITEAAYGPHHPTVAIRVNNLASVLRDLGDLAGARQGLERALRIITTAWGPDHPQAVAIARNLQSLG